MVTAFQELSFYCCTTSYPGNIRVPGGAAITKSCTEKKIWIKMKRCFVGCFCFFFQKGQVKVRRKRSRNKPMLFYDKRVRVANTGTYGEIIHSSDITLFVVRRNSRGNKSTVGIYLSINHTPT